MNIKRQSTVLSVAITILVSGSVAAEGLNQSGFNVGVTAGGMWGESTFDLYNWEGTNYPDFDDSDSAFVLGGQLGYRSFLSNGFMWGLEADYQRSSYKTLINGKPENSSEYFGQEISNIITARIKAGTLFTDNTLAYVTGGYAYTNGDVTLHDDPGHTDDTDEIGMHGWTAGAGIEHSINNNFSIKGEYLHIRTYDGNAHTYFSSEDEHYRANLDFEADIFRIGINYNF